ncbi:MAG: peptidoglycan-associated lipoprotein Pal [candidate division Zixibacteria bacterium]|nr:peptidoglycan-associated lipoprotein Pal [candidate division Zixibacteria bacterium]
MKRYLLILGLIAIMFMPYGCSCRGKQAPPVEQPTPVDTTPTPPPPPPPPPPQEPATPKVMESDFMIVYFDYDKSNIRTDQRVALDKNAEILKGNPDINIEVEGHCDERGTVEYNIALGDRRAQSVKKYLIDLGISADRIKTISYGKERPAVPGTGEEVWAKNRRAAFRIR